MKNIFFNFFETPEQRVKYLQQFDGAGTLITDEDFIEYEISKFKQSSHRQSMLDGERYYEGFHDIKFRDREIIGADGEKEIVDNLPNNQVVNNQYAKMVKQKTNYLIGKPFKIDTKNETYKSLLQNVFDIHFMKLFKKAVKTSYNSALCYLHPYYTKDNKLKFKIISGSELKPEWFDKSHEKLESGIYFYPVTRYKKAGHTIKEETFEKVEVFTLNGVYRFDLFDVSTDSGAVNRIKPDQTRPHVDYITNNEGQGLNWSRLPLIPIKSNDSEQPLLNRVRSLQDGYNLILSNFQNNMEEDTRNTIIVLVNYDGQNLGEFRKNLATYGAVKVKSTEHGEGDVRTLQVEVNAENYKVILDIFKKAIIENCMGYDAKDDRLNGQANEMNIESIYNDIYLDSKDLELELQTAFDEILWFVNTHLKNTGQGDFFNEKVQITFNRDMIMNRSEAIENAIKSIAIVSTEKALGMHPDVEDPKTEMSKKREEEKQVQKDYDTYAKAFTNIAQEGVVDE